MIRGPAMAAGLLLLAGCVDFGTHPWEPPSPVVAAVSADASAQPPGDGGPGSTGDGSAGTDATASVESACPHPGGKAAEVAVTLITNSFVPDMVRVCRGDKVIWHNQDTKEHTIYSGEPDLPDGMMQSPKIYYGKQWSYTFGSAGAFRYFCTTHKKKMRGAMVIVH